MIKNEDLIRLLNGVPRSDMIYLDWVSQAHTIFLYWVSRFDMITSKENILKQPNILKLKEPISQKNMVWRPESSCVSLISLTNFILASLLLPLVHIDCLPPAKFHSWFHVITLCILVFILSQSTISTQYMLLYTDPYLYFFRFPFVVQRVYQEFWLTLISSQFPAHLVPGWFVHSSSNWIVSVMT